MNLCRCPACQPAAPDPRYCEAWRLECEARSVCRLPTKEVRQKHMEKVAARRGAAAAARLAEDVVKQWKRLRQGTAADGFKQ